MRNVLGWRAVAALGLFGVVALTSARADDPAAAEQEQLKRRGRQLQESLGWYQVVANRDTKEPMKAEIVQRWSNPTRMQKGETALVVWTDGGRPEALASAYPWNGYLVYECVSLARAEGLQAKEGERSVWAPGAPGVRFQAVPDAPVPAKTAVARLAQMRGIAETFKVTMTSMKQGLADREEMRLLPKPVYRYDLAAAKLVHPDLIDGAVFAFVQGTDPEAVLLIEVNREGETTTWRYAFGRATTLTVEAKLGPSVVWKAESQSSWSDPKLPGVAVGRRLVD